MGYCNTQVNHLKNSKKKKKKVIFKPTIAKKEEKFIPIAKIWLTNFT